MSVVRQADWEDLDGFQVDHQQFLISCDLGRDFVEAFLLPLQEACDTEDRLTVVAIVWFMLLANGLPLPSTTLTRRCDPREVRVLVGNLGYEARHGYLQDLHTVLIEAACAAGIYGPHEDEIPFRERWSIRPSKN